MPQSLARVIVHTVFSTKNRVPYLQDATLRQDLYAYMAATLQSHHSAAIIIGGVADHVHLLHTLNRTLTIAELIEHLKTSSSKWIKSKPTGSRDFHWQGGYGIFSVSESKVADVRRYIENQESHHKQISFQDEFREICRRHGVEIDERYVWD